MAAINGIDEEHDFRVTIPFSHVDGHPNKIEHINDWQNHCATAMEMFGLPGDKYTCRVTKEAIEFWFREEKDAVFFELACG